MEQTAHLESYAGRAEEAEERVAVGPVRALAATLDMSPDAADAAGLVEGSDLPPLWHWLSFLPDTPMAGLGPDGHPARGGFLPPVPLERRMWAGGRLEFIAPIRIGDALRRRSEIISVSEKAGKAGPMVLVTVRHAFETPRGPVVQEEQDIVYVARPERYAPTPPVPLPEPAHWREPVAVDPVRLFRFSAVTFNAHRIHYDRPYATDVERYPGLVVHGPLQAILLMEAARRHRDGAWPRRFDFRGVRPAFDFDDLALVGGREAEGAQALFTVTGPETLCMQARVGWT